MSAPMVLLSITPLTLFAVAALIRRGSESVAIVLATIAAIYTSDAERGRRALAALRILLQEKRNRHSLTRRSDRGN